MSGIEHQTEDTPAKTPKIGQSKLLIPSAPAEFRDSAEVLELVTSGDPLNTASSLVERVDETYFVLGGVLSHIKRDVLHARVGYSGRTGFRDYCEKELGIRLRKAQYLIDIYETVCGLELDVGRLREIGWGKAKELVKIARVTDGTQLLKRDFEELVTFAAGHKHDAFVNHIRLTYLDPARPSGDNQIRSTTLRFKLYGEAASRVEEALERAMAEAGNKNPNVALEYIVAEWAMHSRGLAHRSFRPPQTPEQLVAYARQELGLEVHVVGRVEGQASVNRSESLEQELTEVATGSAETNVRKKPRVRHRTDLYN